MHSFTSVTTLGLCSLSLALAACRPSAPAETPAADASPAPSDAAEGSASSAVTKCEGELVPAEDGVIDDFEDGNAQVSLVGGRDGYWWTTKDDKGSEIKTPASGFSTTDGGASSAKAARVAGKTASGADAWGAEFGTNLINTQGSQYDASKYAGLRFKAKAIGPTQKVRVGVSDVNTHQDAGVCKTCWNHFRKDVTLTPEWTEHTVAFAELQQRPGWGEPRPPSVDSRKLIGVSFAVDGGQEFDVWVDDVQLLVCKAQ